MAKLKEVSKDEKLDHIGLVGTFTKLTMKVGGPDRFTYWIKDPVEVSDLLSKLCGQEFAAKNILTEIFNMSGKVRLPGSGKALRVDFAGIKNMMLFIKDGVSLKEVYFEAKNGKSGREYSASITFDIPEMGEDFYKLCRICEKGQDIWIKITDPQGRLFK